jgi:simple sugar transport system permease protein
MSVLGRPADVPRWVSIGLIPAVNLVLAFIAAGLVVLLIYWGQYSAGTLSGAEFLYTPVRAAGLLLKGAFGNFPNWSYTLYYTTNFIFAGLAVAVAFHAGLFNIGVEGQAYIAGLGAGLVCLYLDFLPFVLVLPLAIIASALFGAAWAFIPAYLQAKRGSHIVITTIMFNFIAASLMVYLLVHVLIAPGQQSPESRAFAANTTLPTITEVMAWFGVKLRRLPLNLSFLWSLACCVFVWIFIWRTRWGYALRTVGLNPRAAVYGGISVAGVIILAMCISGALSGFIALNEIMGVQRRILLNFVAGAGFVGIAVSLMGRNHPFGIIFASLLFGALYQGGAELNFDMPEITRDMVVVIQGLVILFAGALENLFRPKIEALFRRRTPALQPAGGTAG